MQNKFCDCDHPRDIFCAMKIVVNTVQILKDDVDVLKLKMRYDFSRTEKLTIPKISPQLRGVTLILIAPLSLIK